MNIRVMNFSNLKTKIRNNTNGDNMSCRTLTTPFRNINDSLSPVNKSVPKQNPHPLNLI